VRPEAISTGRLELLPLARETAQAIADGDWSGLTPGAGWPMEETLMVALRAATDPGALTWLISCDGAVIGECGLKHAPDSGGSAEIGYGIGAAWRANGYGSEAIGGLVGWLADRPECRRVTAEVHESNLPSRRLLERLGFTIDRLASPYVWYAVGLRPVRGPRRSGPASSARG
jgi:RimJ/RimL family protein N-acetyltransferase